MTKILLIEDEDMLRGDIAGWLTFEGYEVLTAADGVEGANAAILDTPDLIICDIMMPRLDGYGVMLHVRANSLTHLTPFIFTTAKVDHDDIRRGMSLGADDYITKPFSRLELLQAVQVQLEKRDAQKREQDLEVESWRLVLEQEHEQRVLKAKMVAMFSHDFRNPLATIMSSISLVRDYADRMDEQRRVAHLNRAEASVRQLIQMLDDMLFLAQADSDNLNLKPESLYVGQFIEQLVEEFKTVYGETHKLFFESHFTDTFMIDPRLLRQIATNLISNAIKYSPPGSKVHVALENDIEHFSLTVKDQGIGIPQSDQSRLFSAFQRGSNVKEKSGTGLGLAIVQQAVDMLGGSVHLESQVGVGTMITVHIPIRLQGNEVDKMIAVD